MEYEDFFKTRFFTLNGQIFAPVRGEDNPYDNDNPRLQSWRWPRIWAQPVYEIGKPAPPPSVSEEFLLPRCLWPNCIPFNNSGLDAFIADAGLRHQAIVGDLDKALIVATNEMRDTWNEANLQRLLSNFAEVINQHTNGARLAPAYKIDVSVKLSAVLPPLSEPPPW